MGIFDMFKTGVEDLFEATPEENDKEKIEVEASHRHDSFAPVRHDAQVKHYVDGQDYCWAVSEAIESARETIFIEDWWLTPELYLRRPPAKYPDYRLDKLLQRKAREGVKIYVVVYKEVEKALTLDSEHTKTALQELDENIIVVRHPDHDIGGTFYWSHHEKFVIVDHRIAFLGGIDLCFGRWDTHAHRLADYSKEPGMELFPGQDYSDARVRDFEGVKNWDERLIDKTVIPRMPWHDMSLCMLGPPVLDVARHFCERWNFVKHEKLMDHDNVPFLEPPLGGFSRYQDYEIPSGQHRRFRHNTRNIKGTCRTQVLRSSTKWSLGLKEKENSIQRAYIDTISKADHFVYIENQFFITATEEKEDFILKNLIGKAIVDRIIRAHEENEKFKVIVVMPLMPAFPADLSTKEASTARLVMYFQYISICRGDLSILEKLRGHGIDNPDDYIRFYSLRSYDRINRSKMEEFLAQSAGYTPQQQQLAEAGQEEGSHRAQFVRRAGEPGFARGTRGEWNVEDEVEYGRVPNEEEADELRDEQRRRYEGVDREEGIASDSVAHDAMRGGDIEAEPWVNDTRSNQPRDARAEAEEASDYVTEELYIHAKLLIADDKVVIMGSSNLNDRSQCGDRDSEIALLVEDMDTIDSKMNGEDFKASRFAAMLRRKLWKEHLGLLPDAPPDEVTDDMLPLPVPQIDTTDSREDEIVQDPLDDETLARWNNTARTNTEAFREVFHCVPDDNVRNWDQYHAFYPNPEKVAIGHVHDPNMSVSEIRGNLEKIQGHLVEFPYEFLKEVDLKGEVIPIIGEEIDELYT